MLLFAGSGAQGLSWRPTLVSTILVLAYRLVSAIGSEIRSRRDRRLLSAMDDQGLGDLGLCRGQIFDAVRSGRASPWSTAA